MTARATIRVLAAALLAILPVTASPVAAEGNAKTGALLARHWCGSCHGVGSGIAADAAPPLESIAERPYEDRWLRAWLADPHPPMPNFSLSRSEIEDIVAYLRALSTP